ncbi:MAG: hypothetical protein R3B70_04465 [Polyangiaceae bacterium]
MGLYTTIVAEDGLRFQIKTGKLDSCAVFEIGDLLPWFFEDDLYRIEVHDGVYEGIAGDGGDEGFVYRWVIIKDHKVHSTHSASLDASGHPLESEAEELGARFGVAPDP